MEIFISNEDSTNLWEALISHTDVTPTVLELGILKIGERVLALWSDFPWPKISENSDFQVFLKDYRPNCRSSV